MRLRSADEPGKQQVALIDIICKNATVKVDRKFVVTVMLSVLNIGRLMLGHTMG